MAKVITFSRVFPSYHPKKGQPTWFVEKIWKSIYMDNVGSKEFANLDKNVFDIGIHNRYEPKHHTIRAGKRWKVGDKFSPRIWSEKPYASKQITIAPDIEIKKVWDLEVKNRDFVLNGRQMGSIEIVDMAINDGLKCQDLFYWLQIFKEDFKGQVICWNEKIVY